MTFDYFFYIIIKKWSLIIIKTNKVQQFFCKIVLFNSVVNDKQSNICLKKKKFVQRVSPAKKIPAQAEGEKKNHAS